MNETLTNAANAIWSSARVLEQRRFEHRYLGGDAAQVHKALDPYRTADGGFAYALEPDGRGPTSQPPHIWQALEVLEELDAIDPAICDHLQTRSRCRASSRTRARRGGESSPAAR
jgi:hypothetical protein